MKVYLEDESTTMQQLLDGEAVIWFQKSCHLPLGSFENIALLLARREIGLSHKLTKSPAKLGYLKCLENFYKAFSSDLIVRRLYAFLLHLGYEKIWEFIKAKPDLFTTTFTPEKVGPACVFFNICAAIYDHGRLNRH